MTPEEKAAKLEAKKAKDAAAAAKKKSLEMYRLISAVFKDYADVWGLIGKNGSFSMAKEVRGSATDVSDPYVIEYPKQEFYAIKAYIDGSFVKGTSIESALGDGTKALDMDSKDAASLRTSKVADIVGMESDGSGICTDLADGSRAAMRLRDRLEGYDGPIDAMPSKSIGIPESLIAEDSIIKIRKSYSGMMIGGEGPIVLDINSNLLGVYQKHKKDAPIAKYSASIEDHGEYNIVLVRSVSDDGKVEIIQSFKTLTV
jgi:hypothetical protein